MSEIDCTKLYFFSIYNERLILVPTEKDSQIVNKPLSDSNIAGDPAKILIDIRGLRAI
jgi:hypothetical protein